MGEGREGWGLGEVVDVLPDRDDLGGGVTSVVGWEFGGSGTHVLLDDVVPDSDGQAALGRVGDAVPVHVPAGLLNDPRYLADIRTSLSKLVKWQIAGCAYESTGVGRFEKLVHLRMRHIVREENRRETVERTGCEQSVVDLLE